MNIGIVTTWFERGAAYVSSQYMHMLESEHKLHIFARADERAATSDTWNESNVTRAKKVPFVGRTAFNLLEFKTWLVKNNIELVIFNEQHWWPPVLLCNELGIVTGAYVDYYTEETVPLFWCYDFLLCNTQRHFSVFKDHPQCFYIPWGTEVNVFQPQTFEVVHANKITFFHSSGMNPIRKGTDFVIQAFNSLPANSQLVIHTQKPLQPLLPLLQPTIDMLVSEKRLVIHEGNVEPPGLYHLGDVYVYPSRLDGIGLTTAEALACGLPVITTDAPPMNEFIEPDINGKLVNVEKFVARADGYYWPQSLVNVENLALQMKWFVENENLLPAYKRSAREHAEKKLSWTLNAADWTRSVGNIKKRSNQELNEAGKAALAFEEKRTTLPQRHPRVFYFLSIAYRPLKQVIARRKTT